jgi:tetratricopeptide (TPR) repeat protein
VLLGGDDPAQDQARTPARDEPKQEQRQDEGGQQQPGQQQQQDGEQTQSVPDNEPEEGPGPPTAGAESPGELNLMGKERLDAGDSAGAIELLEQADQGFRSQGDGADTLTWGYALYNLGLAYEAAGRPEDAITAYERRLQVSPEDQRKTVEKALKRAQKAVEKG